MEMDAGEIFPVILCGGSGTRLWPRSRPTMPKPFLPLLGERTLFQEALLRCSDDAMFGKPTVVSGAVHLAVVREQARGFELSEIIVEPQPRQTAAAVALAARRLDENAVMLICPSDHHIDDVRAFRRAAATAAELARQGCLVCLGVEPCAPETRFGYIRRGEPLGDGGFRVAEFVEKPGEATAAAYLASGQYAWNGGIFAFRASDYLRELERFRPSLSAAVDRSVAGGDATAGLFYPEAASFAEIDPESIDYAVMENTQRAALVMADMGWSDVGDWQAVYEMRTKDELGNSVRGQAQLLDCSEVLVDSDGPKVHAIGLDRVMIVIDGDDILVASASGASRVGKLAQS